MVVFILFLNGVKNFQRKISFGFFVFRIKKKCLHIIYYISLFYRGTIWQIFHFILYVRMWARLLFNLSRTCLTNVSSMSMFTGVQKVSEKFILIRFIVAKYLGIQFERETFVIKTVLVSSLVSSSFRISLQKFLSSYTC